MAITVIHNLEAVDIHEKDGRGLVLVPLLPIHHALQTSQKQGSPWKAGERIVGGVKKQLFLSMFSFCYVSGIVNNAADILMLNQVSNNTLEIKPPVVRMSHPEFDDRILAVP